MRKVFLPRHFLASVILLLVLVSVYAFSESQRLRRELMRQTAAKGAALAEAIETSAKNAILGNSLLEEQIGQRLLDNARLIDQLLISGPADQDFLKKIGAMNHLQKVELLDTQGQPWEPPVPPRMPMEMKAWMHGLASDEASAPHPPFKPFMWGRHWPLPMHREQLPEELPPRLKERKFWEGSVFGVAVSARAFRGVIVVHANADYILNFKKEIGVQRQIEELGHQSDIDYIALLDSNLKIVAHTDPALLDKQETDPLILKVKADGQELGQIAEREGGKRDYEVVKPIRLNGSTLGLLQIGLSLDPVEAAWRNNLSSIIVLGLTILAVGILGMAVIFYNQHSHMQAIKDLEAEVALRDRLSSLGNLAATVAHEIRNPLNSISMGLQRLRGEFRPVQDEAEYSHFIDLMRGEVQRLNSIVEEFLLLARPLDLKFEEVRIDELLKELATLAGSYSSSTKVEISIATPRDLPPAKVDRNYFKQLLLNLVLNGIQAMPEGGRLTLEAKATEGNLILTVADTGAGISKEILPRIFEPYFTTKTKGSGLGLVIARRIAEAHGGRLTAESEVGQGSRFRVSIPLTNPPR
jgi:signal transduction histidine kinase